jgi:uncharacterized protein YcnI
MSRTLVCAVLASFCLAAPASAHISLEKGGTHLSRYGESYLKDLPCGKAGGTRGTNIYTYAPGATINVSIVETIPHPSYFRIAFQQSGDDQFKEPASIKPIDPNRKCPDGPGDHCGASDFYNTSNVLPGLDNLSPHLAGAADARYTWAVKLPNVECDNCTLQIIQVMQDDQFHGPYDPTPGVGIEDIYHQCIDLVLKNGAPMDNGDAGVGGGGGSGGGGSGGNPGTGGSGAPHAGGCSFVGDAALGGLGGALVGVALVALGYRRRRLNGRAN